jgi:purine-binding chemotaxis protein CheW
MRFATDGGQYLTFALDGQEYAVEILKVQEIRGYSPATPIPNTPAYVRGVMNLRGTIIPVVDLRGKLSMREAPYTAFTVIIVVNAATKVTGIIVDAVSDVLSIARTELQAAPDFGAHVDAHFVSGMARAGEHLIVVLDIDRVLEGDEITTLAAAS